MREVMAYGDIESIKNHPRYETIRTSFHITDTKETANFLNNKAIFNHKAVAISTVLHEIISDWRNENVRFAQHLNTSKTINEMEHEELGENRVMLNGFRKNHFEVYSTLRLLTESHLVPDDLAGSGNPHIELLQSIWKKVCDIDPSFNRLWDTIDSFRDDKKLNTTLMKIFGTDEVESIVFHNFYFITPIQEAIIRILEGHGVRIIIAGPIEYRHHFVYEIWRKTLREDYGYPPYEDWIFGDFEKEDPFSDMVEGYTARACKDICIKKYDSALSFVQDIRENYSFGWDILSPDENTANEMMYSLNPDLRTAHNFLSYPIGRFIDSLYSMWDDSEENIIITEELLYECFSSGWIHIGEKDSRDYSSDLECLLCFFKGCKTVEEWSDRIENYSDIINNAVAMMDTTVGKSEDYEENIMGNPLRFFSMFSLDLERVDVVFTIIKDIITIAKGLFAGNDQINVKAHLTRLNNIVIKGMEPSDSSIDEKSIIESLKNKIQRFEDMNLTCYPSDISHAITDYLADKYIEKDGESLYIKPFDNVCGLSQRDEGKLHICLCDIDRLPGRSNYIWPLNRDAIDSICSKKCETDKRALVKQLKCIIEETPLRNRYLMGLLMRNKHVVLSWIENMDDKMLSPSPYISLIERMSSVSIQPVVRINPITNKDTPQTLKSKIIEEPLKLKEANMDLGLCIYRYIYGYLLTKRPVVKDTFLQQFAISGLIKAINNLIDDNTENVAEKIFEIFPNMKNIEKRQIKDFTKWIDKKDSIMARFTESESGRQYTNQRLRIYFSSPGDYVLKKALARNGKTDYSINEDSIVCNYCPFRIDCTHTNYGDDGVSK